MAALKDLLKLSIPERILLVEELWDSIEQEADSNEIFFTEEQRLEIERRIDLIEQGKTKFYTWEEVKAKVKANLQK